MPSVFPDHLDESAIECLIHGELSPAEEAAARAHEAQCPECSRRLADAVRTESEALSLLRRLDIPPTTHVSAEMIAARAGSPLPPPAARFRRSTWRRWAASILLAVGIAGAAYAIPGSPVRVWVEAVVERIRQDAGDARGGDAGTTVPGAARPGSSASGVSVEPGATLLIRFTSGSGGNLARVSLTGGSEVFVRAPAGAATYDSGPEILTIQPRARSVVFEIAIPRTAPRVEMTVEGTRILLKEGDRVITASPPDSEGAYTLPLDIPVP